MIAIQTKAVKAPLRDMVIRMVQGLSGFMVSGFRVPVFSATGYGSSSFLKGKAVVKRGLRGLLTFELRSEVVNVLHETAPRSLYLGTKGW